MSHPPGDSTRDIAYDPLPLTNDDHQSNALYNAPPSPDPRNTMFHTPQSLPSQLPDDSFIPPGAAQPRFLGAALYDGPNARDSIASSQVSFNPASEYNSSVYALNDPTAAGSYRDDPRGSYYSGAPVPLSPVGPTNRMLEEKRNAYASPRRSRSKILVIAAVAALIIILAVMLPVYFFIIKNNDKERSTTGGKDPNDDSTSHSGTASAPASTASVKAVWGGDGTTVDLEDGTTFVYKNSFGGHWYYDPNDPLNNGAKAQSWTAGLNETFNYGIDKIRGVNLGGWLNTEPFISPALYEKYLNAPTPVVDEWTLSQAMAADTAGGGLGQMEDHYKTFITEKDFADIAAAGLNWVRIPIGWWAIEVWPGEPFLPKVSWTYFLKAIKWARKYGLRINLDLHALPGSQNGWNHSGRLGTIGFLNGPMGYANAQRSLDYIRILAEFISQPQYRDIVPMFGIINEPQGGTFGQDALARFYMEAYKIIRTAGGTGAGNGPYISFHDGFIPRGQWVDFIPNADRISLDTHPYLCFGGQSTAPMSSYANTPCSTWGSAVNSSMRAFGLTNAGEFSNAVTDCGLFLNGVNLGTRYEGDYPGVWPRQGDCATWTNYKSYTPAMKADIKQFALASMDALQHYFFWTWKIGPSLRSGEIETPAWSYQLGLQNNWMPTDPRDADGICGNTSPWTPPLSTGSGNIPAAALASLSWPPPSISMAGNVANLPSYTATGPIPTLPVPTQDPKATSTVDWGNGWNNAADTAGVALPISSCQYLDPWVDPGTAPPPVCAAGARRDVPAPSITPAPAV